MWYMRLFQKQMGLLREIHVFHYLCKDLFGKQVHISALEIHVGEHTPLKI
jgi:hypothetical protein